MIVREGSIARMSLLARGLVGTCPRRNELFLDLVVNPPEPLLSSLGANLELITLCLQLFDAILGGTQLQRKLMRQLHGAVAAFVRQIGCLLEQRDDRLSELIHSITIIARRFFLGVQIPPLARVCRARSGSCVTPHRDLGTTDRILAPLTVSGEVPKQVVDGFDSRLGWRYPLAMLPSVFGGQTSDQAFARRKRRASPPTRRRG